ncbi:hypothetical protein PIB30_002374 [Stylosanthes scabra]|uniref:Uncharacterized protein n=1 Tax=Stylosanthes scabra TaxID=79078 RepID=A0ABU6V641_9FABA|nr:hypothetical protein [Stylosanthes scabra]
MPSSRELVTIHRGYFVIAFSELVLDFVRSLSIGGQLALSRSRESDVVPDEDEFSVLEISRNHFLVVELLSLGLAIDYLAEEGDPRAFFAYLNGDHCLQPIGQLVWGFSCGGLGSGSVCP